MKRPSLEDIQASLWFWPTLGVLVSFGGAVGLLSVRPPADGALARLAWPGNEDSARAVLQVISTAVITVTSLSFSLVVVALQLASQQFSPRLLRDFARDWVIQATLSLFASTFVFSLTVLRGMGGQSGNEPLPAVALFVAYALALASVVALLGFLAHIVRRLRIDTMMVVVHQETVTTIDEFYSSYGAEKPPRPGPELPGPGDGTPIMAKRSGFLKVVDLERLAAAAAREDVFLRLLARPGDHVVRGTPAALAWAFRGEVPKRLEDDLDDSIKIGYERTMEQDAALGLRLLADIAVKALSPGINDPTTATHAIGYAADLIVRLSGRHLGEIVRSDEKGAPRVVFPDRDFGYYLDLVCGQVRRYGRGEPTVLISLLALLRDAAVAARDDEQRANVADEARLVAAETSEELAPEDREAVVDMHRRVGEALAGRLDAAYLDRSGETRSV